MSNAIVHPPILSTPDSISVSPPVPPAPGRTCEDVYLTYEIDRTVSEIKRGKWRRIALQFPDDMLADAPTIYEALRAGLGAYGPPGDSNPVETDTKTRTAEGTSPADIKLYILGDTSYGACCVDEVAAQHVDADVVVHYGRACLSPTARLPVVYVFTVQPLVIDNVVGAFQEIFLDKREQVILMADVPYSSHLPRVAEALSLLGYINLHTAKVVYDPSSPLPNRTAPREIHDDSSKLKQWQIFYISQPPDSLLLILSSRVSKIHIFSTSDDSSDLSIAPLKLSTEQVLRRRYALLTSVSSALVLGILINTLSVKNYLDMVERVKSQIFAAGKKYYTMVVGKVNASKMANFSEIGGWVVIGCWESSLIESKDFWKPIITPFELELALRRAEERVWTGKWISDFQSVLEEPETKLQAHNTDRVLSSSGSQDEIPVYDSESELESAPPEYDLRTGRYMSETRPLRPVLRSSSSSGMSNALESSGYNKSLMKRHNEVATIGGSMSPGAEFLKSKRTWKGLGSDFEIAYENSDTSRGAVIEEGRNGIAKGYTVGNETSRR
jgi:diphthamide biosynthesis protein 2